MRYLLFLCCSVFLVMLSESLAEDVFVESPQKASSKSAVGFEEEVPEPSVEHKLELHPFSGLPSRVEVQAEAGKIIRVDGLFVLDGELLVVPLEPRRGYFEGMLPTPSASLRYQFRITSVDGKTRLSEVFSVNPSCPAPRASETAALNESFPGQRKLLAEALESEREVEMLKYAIGAVEGILKRSAGTRARMQ